MTPICLWLNRHRRPRLWADEWLACVLVDAGLMAAVIGGVL